MDDKVDCKIGGAGAGGFNRHLAKREMTGMGAQTIRFLIQISFALAGMVAVVLIPAPYGPTLGLFLVVFGLWLGRRVFTRIATLDEVKKDLRDRVDEGP